MSTSSKPRAINRDFIVSVGAQVLAAQLAGMRDPSNSDNAHLDRLADLAVRAAVALDAAVPRAEERMEAEAKAAQEAEHAKESAEKAAAKEAAAEAKQTT